MYLDVMNEMGRIFISVFLKIFLLIKFTLDKSSYKHMLADIKQSYEGRKSLKDLKKAKQLTRQC
jgi:hypothetical protein